MNNIYINQYKLFNHTSDSYYDSDTNNYDFIVNNKIMVYTKINSPILLPITFYNDIKWKYIDNFILPYTNNNILIPYLQLNNHNPYDYISSASIIPDDEIITGEKFQFLADIVLGSPSSLYWNPNNVQFSKNIENINRINTIDNFKSIFVFTHDLEYIDRFNINDKILITHNSDHEINKNYNAKLHLAQNCYIKDNNIIPIPIGIENKQWFDHNILFDVRKMNINKSKHIYFFFNLNTHPSRKNCFDKLISKIDFNVARNKKDYFIELAKHKYAICPRGNGLDTHRIWECLYLNVIPIVIKNDFINIDHLPIIVLNDWNDINTISDEFYNIKLSKLTISYYKHLLENIK